MIKRITYKEPRLSTALCKLTLDKSAPGNDFTHEWGIVTRVSGNTAGCVSWGTIAYLLPEALAVSPELRADIRKALDEADAKAAPVPA